MSLNEDFIFNHLNESKENQALLQGFQNVQMQLWFR